MNKTSIIQTGKVASAALATVALLGLGSLQTQAQSFTFNFSDGTSDGWTTGGFSAGTPLTVSSINGNNYIFVPTGSFQAANVATGYTGTPSAFNTAMFAAINDPAGYEISYNYSINTANITGGTFLQLGVFVNTGLGSYAQDYSTPNQLSFNGTQLASGQTFTGTVTETLATMGFSDANASTENFFRLGIIANGNGTGDGANYTDISITPIPVPEPATITLCGLGLAAGAAFLRRRKA